MGVVWGTPAPAAPYHRSCRRRLAAARRGALLSFLAGKFLAAACGGRAPQAATGEFPRSTPSGRAPFSPTGWEEEPPVDV